MDILGQSTMTQQLINQFIVVNFRWHIIHKVWASVLLATLSLHCESWHDILIKQNSLQAGHV